MFCMKCLSHVSNAFIPSRPILTMARRTKRTKRAHRARKSAKKRVLARKPQKRQHFAKAGAKKAAIYFLAAATAGLAYWYLKKKKKL